MIKLKIEKLKIEKLKIEKLQKSLISFMCLVFEGTNEGLLLYFSQYPLQILMKETFLKLQVLSV